MHRIQGDAQCEEVAIFGLGNVALDCARVLLRDEAVLGRTDIARHAQDALRRSAVKRVDIIGRRGPVQARFSMSGSAGFLEAFLCLLITARRCLRMLHWTLHFACSVLLLCPKDALISPLKRACLC